MEQDQWSRPWFVLLCVVSFWSQVWDTAGQERFRCITRNYYHGANGILLVFDVTNRESFDKIHTWMKEINENTHDSVPILLMGNKIDQDKRVVSKEEGQKLAKMYENVTYVETSAKTGETDIKETSVCDVFADFVRSTYKRFIEINPTNPVQFSNNNHRFHNEVNKTVCRSNPCCAY